MEHQIEEQLEHQVRETQRYPNIQMRIQEHLDATKQHRDRMAQCLDSHQRKPATGKGAMTGMMGTLLGALSPTRMDSLAKTARDDYLVEHTEIAAYELLIATAQLCGDTTTVRAHQLNLADEVRMANWLEQNLPKAAFLSLEQGEIAVDQQAKLDASDTAVRVLRSAQGQVSQVGQPGMPPADQLDQTAQPSGTI
jgi:ferritin-like metal-binding protein YciE